MTTLQEAAMRKNFEDHWLKVRGAKKAKRELARHPLQPQTYVQDSANRHWVTWQAALAQQGEPVNKCPRCNHEQSHIEYTCDNCGRSVDIDSTATPKPAQPTSGDYALGYAEGFNDACKPAPQAQDVMELVDALEKLARLGNGEHYGNSDGNMIARTALSKYKGAK